MLGRLEILIVALLTVACISFFESNVQSEQPSWVGSKAGISDKVFPPFTSVSVGKDKIECWGRSYIFSNLPFPAEVVTQGDSILYSPIELQLTIDDKEFDFGTTKKSIKKISDSYAVLESNANTDSFNISGKSTVEYDGMIRIDLDILPKGEITVNKLIIKIPLKKEYVSLYHIFPNGTITSGEERGKFTASGAFPGDGLYFSFKPYIWIGNQGVGLAWFCETDKGWNSRRAKKIEVIPDDDKVILIAHIIDRPTKTDKPLNYTFGLQASPVKPVPSDFHEKIHVGPVYKPLDEIPLFTGDLYFSYPPYGNINPNQGTLEMWLKAGFNPLRSPDRDIFMVSFPAGQKAVLRWSAANGLIFYAKHIQKDIFDMTAHTYWKEDETHHVALTWGDKISIYIDGKLIVQKPFIGLVGGSINESSLVSYTLLFFGAGSTWGTGVGGFVFDEIKISDIPKTTFELSKLEADEYTLLLDNLDENFVPDSERETKAAKISEKCGGLGGVPMAGTKFVNTKFGKGLSTVSEPIQGRTIIDYWKELGVNVIIGWSSWTEIHNNPGTFDLKRKENLKNLVIECHKRDIKVVLYIGENSISSISPYLKEWGDKIYREPKGGWNLYPGEDVILTCYKSVWQDFMVDGIRNLINEYDIDGVYLDGTTQPLGCTNGLHGCGYRGRFDTLIDTTPIFAVRNTIKRIYHIVKETKKDGIIIGHPGISLPLPTISFVDVMWSGENFSIFSDLISKDPLAACPIETFQSHYFGKNLGVPNEMLAYNFPPFWTSQNALAYSLVHDTLIAGPIESKSKIWKIFSDFEVSKAKWYPYWDNADFVKVSSDNIKVSFYKKEKSVLFVISNLCSKPLEKGEENVKIDLNFSKLDISGKTVYDVMTKEKIKLNGSTLNITLRPFRMKMVIVE